MPRVRSSTATTSANRLVTLSSWMSGASVASATLTGVLLRVPRVAHCVARGGAPQGRTRGKGRDPLYGAEYRGGAFGPFPPRCAARGRADRRLLPRGGL